VNVQNLAFYEVHDDRFAPTQINVSPWNGNAQNGIAIAGLVAHLLASNSGTTEMHCARLTIDILGVVPRVPLEPRINIIRDGRRIQLVEVMLSAAGRSYVRATALRARTEQTPEQAHPLTRRLPDPAAAEGKLPWVRMDTLAGGFMQIGPGARWVQFPRLEVVAGHAMTPLERVAMVSDFGSGTAPLASPKDWSFANLDICIHLSRLPRGEWLLIDVTSESSGNGCGLVHSRLGDVDGMFGHAHQTVFLDPRPQ